MAKQVGFKELEARMILDGWRPLEERPAASTAQPETLCWVATIEVDDLTASFFRMNVKRPPPGVRCVVCRAEAGRWIETR